MKRTFALLALLAAFALPATAAPTPNKSISMSAHRL